MATTVLGTLFRRRRSPLAHESTRYEFKGSHISTWMVKSLSLRPLVFKDQFDVPRWSNFTWLPMTAPQAGHSGGHSDTYRSGVVIPVFNEHRVQSQIKNRKS